MVKAAPYTDRKAFWSAVDQAFARSGYPSRRKLCRAAGVSHNLTGQQCRGWWPKTETLHLLLAAAGISWTEFGQMVDDALRNTTEKET